MNELEAAGVILVQDGNHGANRPRKEEIVSEGIPHVRAADISTAGRIDFFGAQKVAETVWERNQKGRAQGDDVLLSHKGTVGRVARVPADVRPFLCSPQTTFWRALRSDQLTQGYLYAFLRSPAFRAQLNRVMDESDMAPYVSLTNQRQFAVPLPRVEEQRAIESVLGALDNKIDGNQRLRQAQIAIRATRYRHLYDHASGRGALALLACEVKDRVEPSATPTTTFEQFSIPAFDAGEDPEICPGASMASGKTRIPDGDIVLVSKLNPAIPRIWHPVSSGIGQTVCSPEFLVLRSREGVPYAWLDACVRHDRRFYEQLLGGVTGTTGSRQRVKPSDAMAATVPTPGAEAIADWAAFAGPMIEREATLILEARALTAIRNALLPKLVSGQIRVPLSEDPEEQVGAAVEALDA